MSEIESTPADVKAQAAFEKGRRRGKSGKPRATPQPEEKSAPEGDGAPPKEDQRTQPYYFDDDAGLWYVGTRSTKEGIVWINPVWICARFKVKYRARLLDGMGWRFIIEIVDRDGRHRDVTLLDAEIGGMDGGWYRVLADAGLRVHPKKRSELAQYFLMECDDAPRARAVEKTGWCGRVYVMPHRTVGQADEAIIYEGQDRTDAFGESGTVDEWKAHVGHYCPGNSRLILAVCAALAAPLLPLAGVRESGGLHLLGGSSEGKTTSGRVAASVNGPPSTYMSTWRGTGCGIEGTAARSNHALLILDEIREAGEREIGNTVMMLGNGSGKLRMRDTATMRERLTWLLLWLSTGEHKLSHYLEAAGLKPDPGMEVRQLDIPANAGAGHGIYEKLHGMESGAALAAHFATATERYHGAVGVAWLENIHQRYDEIVGELPDKVRAMADHLLPENAESQVHRAVQRFALLAVAGEYATAWGLTGWKRGDATSGIKKCLSAWIDSRGGTENLEEVRILERFREFIGKHWTGRFVPWTRADDDHAPGKDGTVGFRKTENDRTTFYVTSEGWAEIFKGMDPHRAGQVLLSRKILKPGTWSRGNKTEIRPYRREYLPGGMGRRQCYVTADDAFSGLDDSQRAAGDFEEGTGDA